MPGEELTYGSYLRIPELLSLQRPRSSHPEELHFVVVHQALELWMKLLLHDLDRIVAAVDAGQWLAALHLQGRVNRVLATMLDQMRSLHSLPPADLHEFRTYLGTASGSQSVQFRELELRSGLREPAYLKALEIEHGGSLPPVLAARLAERSLAEALTEAAARLGVTALADWAALYQRGGPDTGFYLLCEALVDYDELWTRWRLEHVALVQRTLGDHARGTGGTAISYLQRTTRYRFFPVLWALRDELVVRGGGELIGRPPPSVSGWGAAANGHEGREGSGR